jgi:16S rRNA processing protein RimM
MLLAGEVGKPHGLAGEVYVVVISDDPDRFSPGANLHHADGRKLTVATSRSHGDRFLVTFEGITTREEATFLRGALYVPAEQARSLDEDEFWHDELIGCTVVTTEGDEAGSVSAIIAGAAQDLLQLETPTGQRFVPIVKEIVVRVDRDARQIVIDPPEGLLD